jgi:hypothetical protein
MNQQGAGLSCGSGKREGVCEGLVNAQKKYLPGSLQSGVDRTPGQPVLDSDVLKTGNVVGCLSDPCRVAPVLVLRSWLECDPLGLSYLGRVSTGP